MGGRFGKYGDVKRKANIRRNRSLKKTLSENLRNKAVRRKKKGRVKP